MKIIIYFKKYALFILLFFNHNAHAQQVYDYIAGYAYPTTTLPRQNIDVNIKYAHGNKFGTDGQDIFYIINNVGNSKFESFGDILNIIEPTFKDTFNSELVFLKYNINGKNFTAKTFGSNYMNSVYRVQMDEQKKSICAIISTCGDTVRLNPDNKNEIIVYPERLQRYWLVIFDLQGKLLSKCLLAESSYSLAMPLNNFHLGYLHIAKFDFNNNIILGFQPNSKVSNILPGQLHDSIKLSQLEIYFIGYNQQSSQIEWLRRLNKGLPNYISHSIPGKNFLMSVNMSKKPNSFMDSIILITDEYGKTVAYTTSANEGLKDGEVKTFVFDIDEGGNVGMFLNFNSKDNDKKAHVTRITSLLQNQDDVLVIITSADSVQMNGQSFIGTPDKYEKTGTGQLARRYCLLKIKLNSPNDRITQLLNFKDSIVPKELIKAKTGFYILFTYSNTSTSFNILPTDTIINFQDDKLHSYPLHYNRLHTVCRYDSVYQLKWMHKSSLINSISDFGDRVIIDYVPILNHDLNFEPGIISTISPAPQLVMAGMYNCKPIAYFDTIQKGNTIEFINLSEYNCNYTWDFGDGTISHLKSPTHNFERTNSAPGYTISLIVSNTCGSDTFVRYFENTTSISETREMLQLKIYPNPLLGNTLFISKQNNAKLKSIHLYNSFGQLIEKFKLENIFAECWKLQLSNDLAHGIYYVKATSEDESHFVSKLLIQ